MPSMGYAQAGALFKIYQATSTRLQFVERAKREGYSGHDDEKLLAMWYAFDAAYAALVPDKN